MAVRLSLGGTRRQLLSQLLTESVLLAVLGGIVSLFVANLTLGLLTALLPVDTASTLHFSLHTSVVVFAAVLSLGTGLLFGLFPALQSTRPDLVSTLRAGSGKLAGARSAARFRTSLVVAQIALSMALLAAAGLFVKSLTNVSRVDLGLKIDRVVTFGISPELNGYAPARSKPFFARLEEELAAIPGVDGVSSALVPVLSNSSWGSDVAVQGFKRGPDIDANSRFNEVGPGYFRTLGMPVVAGREFSVGDALGSPKVAIVNEAFTRKFNLGRDAIGKFIGANGGDTTNMQIVGVVKDAKYDRVKRNRRRVHRSVPAGQPGRQPAFLRADIRTSAGVARGSQHREKLDPNLPVESLKALPQGEGDVYLDRMISISTGPLLATLRRRLRGAPQLVRTQRSVSGWRWAPTVAPFA